MSYEGNVADLDLVGRLVDLAREHFTGAMRFENDGIIKVIYFKDGDILSASTNDRTDSIDEMLLRSGKITREHLKQALGKRKESETLGDALLNLGFITRKELTWARRVQVLGIIRSILTWNAGTYEVMSDYLPKREEGTIFALPQIVIELIVTEPDRTRFERLLDSGNATFEREADFATRFQQLDLNQDAEEIAAQIDGTRSAAEVASITGKDAFNVYKLLHALELLGMLHRVDRSPRPAPAPAPASLPAGSVSQAPVTEAPLPVEPIPPGDLWTAESWSNAPNARIDAFEASENAPSGSTVPSTTLPLELSGVDSTAAPADADLLPDPYDPDSVRSQVEENLGGEPAQERRPGRPVWGGALLAILLLVLLGAAGYFYWMRNRSEADTSAVKALPAAVRKSGNGSAAPLPPTGTTASAGDGMEATNLRPSSAVTALPGGPTSTQPPVSDGDGNASVVATSAPNTSPRSPSTTSKAPLASDAGTRKSVVTSPGRDVPPPTNPRRNGSATKPAAAANVEGETQFHPATATSRATITNIGSGAPARKPQPPSVNPSAPSTGAEPAVRPENDALRARYDALAARHASSIPSGEPYAIQIELVCRTESITRALASGGNDLWFVPTSFRGQKCYRVFWRHFQTSAAARAALSSVPSALAAGSTPSVARVP
jgi:hypothetical protein